MHKLYEITRASSAAEFLSGANKDVTPNKPNKTIKPEPAAGATQSPLHVGGEPPGIAIL